MEFTIPKPVEHFPAGMRLRPSMYIGSTDDRGLMFYVREVLDYGLDEFRSGQLTRITMTLHHDQSITVTDDGRGLSVEPLPPPQTGTELEKQLTNISWSHRRSGTYCGACPLGLSTVNALSSVFSAETRSNGKRGTIRYACGQVVNALQVEPFSSDEGITLRFRFDDAIFPHAHLDGAKLRQMLWEQAALHPGVRIDFDDETTGSHDCFRLPDGVTAMVRQECEHDHAIWPEPLRLEMHEGPFRYDVAIHCVQREAFSYTAFANGASTPSWGTHVVATRDALAKVLRRLARQDRAEKTWLPLEKLLRGIVVAIAADLPDARYEGPTKEKLANHEIEQSIRDFVEHGLTNLLNRKPDHLRTWQEWLDAGISG